MVRALGQKMPDLPPDESLKKAKEVSDNPSAENLAWLYSIHPDKEPIKFIILLNCWRGEISKELNKRVETYAVGRELVAYQVKKELKKLEPSLILPLTKALKVEKVKTHRPWAYDTEDLLWLAVDKAIEQHKELSQSIQDQNHFPVPDLPPDFFDLPEESKPLQDKIHIAMIETLTEGRKFFLPLLRGELENMPEVIRQALRDYYRKQKRHQERRVYAQLDELEQEGSSYERDQLLMKRLGKAYEILINQHGEKARHFIDAMMGKDKTLEEASNEAGISRQMGSRYRREIIKVLLPTK